MTQYNSHAPLLRRLDCTLYPVKGSKHAKNGRTRHTYWGVCAGSGAEHRFVGTFDAVQKRFYDWAESMPMSIDVLRRGMDCASPDSECIDFSRATVCVSQRKTVAGAPWRATLSWYEAKGYGEDGSPKLERRQKTKTFPKAIMTKQEARDAADKWVASIKTEQTEKKAIVQVAEEEEDMEAAEEKPEVTKVLPEKLYALAYHRGSTFRYVMAFASDDAALDAADISMKALEVAGVDGEYTVDELPIRW